MLIGIFDRLLFGKPYFMDDNNFKVIILANGCFWCTEAVFQRLSGVIEVVSGYTGGQIKNPAYREIGTGRTGHAEAIKITYDSSILKFDTLLEVFFATHDPTTLNRQGYDVGTQYRSEIFYTNLEQKEKSEQFIAFLETEKVFENPIVTAVTEAGAFYEAEEDHQEYYNQNNENRYCQLVINPKIKKLQNHFKEYLK